MMHRQQSGIFYFENSNTQHPVLRGQTEQDKGYRGSCEEPFREEAFQELPRMKLGNRITVLNLFISLSSQDKEPAPEPTQKLNHQQNSTPGCISFSAVCVPWAHYLMSLKFNFSCLKNDDYNNISLVPHRVVRIR